MIKRAIAAALTVAALGVAIPSYSATVIVRTRRPRSVRKSRLQLDPATSGGRVTGSGVATGTSGSRATG